MYKCIVGARTGTFQCRLFFTITNCQLLRRENLRQKVKQQSAANQCGQHSCKQQPGYTLVAPAASPQSRSKCTRILYTTRGLVASFGAVSGFFPTVKP